ncbi:MAG: hypothetical protein HC764_24785 [Pleurocapsa sp. CRU_1_2]|nr:hypothetical protein [Pleurocapsa sp. CRU_1_2]
MFRTTPTSNADATLSSPATAKSKQKVFVLSALAAFLGLLGFSALGLAWFNSRYAVSDEMQVELKELSNVEYPANAALLSKDFQRYSNRKLSVIRRDDTHFDFVLEPTDENTAKIVIKNVDLSLMVPRAPEWVKQDAGLETIMFVNREWNRQQVSFPADSEHIEITGGDGFEKESIVEVALTNNCLNAGYWEVSLLTKEDNKKSLYYQGWFTFPMGHYKNVFETINNLPYWKHGWRLEHWQGPNGTVVPVESLRQVINEKVASAQFPTDERIIASGEQGRKVRVMLAKNLTTWQDFIRTPMR